MFLREIITLLEKKISPKFFKLNSEIYGIHYGQKNDGKIINKVMLTLDLSIEAIHHAIKKKVNLIISQRGLVYEPIINFNKSLIQKLTLLTKYPLSIFVLNTPFIAAEGGISDTIRETLFLKLDNTLNIKTENGRQIPIGRICVPQEYPNQERIINLEDLLKRIKNNLYLEKVLYIGNLNKSMNKICIIGSNTCNNKFLKKAIGQNCDCYISGFIDYTDINFARDTDIALIRIPYFKYELIALKKLCNILSIEFPRDEFFIFNSEDPVRIY